MIKPYGLCRHVEGPHHDCAYVDARNRLIPRALVKAEAAVSSEVPGMRRDANFVRAFFAAMDDMSATPRPSYTWARRTEAVS